MIDDLRQGQKSSNENRPLNLFWATPEILYMEKFDSWQDLSGFQCLEDVLIADAQNYENQSWVIFMKLILYDNSGLYLSEKMNQCSGVGC